MDLFICPNAQLHFTMRDLFAELHLECHSPIRYNRTKQDRMDDRKCCGLMNTHRLPLGVTK